MLYYDGVDSLGRPVVVVNADAVAAKVLPHTRVLLSGSALRGAGHVYCGVLCRV